MNASTQLINSDSSMKNTVNIEVTQAADINLTNLVTTKGYLFLAIEIVLMLVILVGNGLTITAIFTTPSLQSVTYRLVFVYCLLNVLKQKLDAALFVGTKTTS